MTLRFGKRGTACAALLLAACGADDAKQTHDMSASDLELAMSALENPIISCQLQAGECVQQASELSALQGCRTQIGECLRAAGERVLKVADGVGACREQQRTCLRGGSGQSGSCFDGFEACVRALVDSEDGGAPGLPGTPTLPLDAGTSASSDASEGEAGAPDATTPVAPPSSPVAPGSDAGVPDSPTPSPGLDEAGLPSAPTFPGLSDGGLPGFPRSPGFPQPPGNECLEGLRACVDKPGLDLIQCAGEARACLLRAALPDLPFP